MSQDLQTANLDLLLQLDRLLKEADRAKALRDHLLDLARRNPKTNTVYSNFGDIGCQPQKKEAAS